MTRKPSRLRPWLKWTALVAGGVFSVLWILSLFLSVRLWLDGRTVIGSMSGEFYLIKRINPHSAPGKFFIEFGLFLPVELLPRLSPTGRAAGVFSHTVSLPYWIPALMFGGPGLLLWHRDRPPPPGRCQRCGYDLTGNVSGRCPECGEAT